MAQDQTKAWIIRMALDGNPASSDISLDIV
jgi:hypothetical protein